MCSIKSPVSKCGNNKIQHFHSLIGITFAAKIIAK